MQDNDRAELRRRIRLPYPDVQEVHSPEPDGLPAFSSSDLLYRQNWLQISSPKLFKFLNSIIEILRCKESSSMQFSNKILNWSISFSIVRDCDEISVAS